MATESVKALLLMGILGLASVVQAQTQPEPVEPELEIKLLPPMVRIEPGDYDDYEPMVIGGPCNLTEQQKDIAWKNVLEAVKEKYPEHSKYCETRRSHTTKMFIVVNDVCRAYVTCVKTVDGVVVLRGKFRVEVDETTLEVRRFINVAW